MVRMGPSATGKRATRPRRLPPRRRRERPRGGGACRPHPHPRADSPPPGATAGRWAVLVVVLVLWLAGLFLRVAGNAVHLLLIVALAILIYNLLVGRRGV